MDWWSGTLGNIIASLIGTIAGYFVGLKLFKNQLSEDEKSRARVKHKEELSIKIRILEAIDLELELNMDSISKETFLEDEIKFPSLPFTRNALDS